MGIEKVREEVIAKAKKDAAAIIAEGQKEALTIVNAAEEKAKIRKKASEAEVEKELMELKIREMSSAELEASKSLLETKKKLIEEAFEEAKQRISKTAPSARKEHIKALMSKAKKQTEIGKILCNESDVKHVEAYKAQITDISGGIIAENKDETIRIDYSYESILNKIRENSLKDVAKILFKTE